MNNDDESLLFMLRDESKKLTGKLGEFIRDVRALDTDHVLTSKCNSLDGRIESLEATIRAFDRMQDVVEAAKYNEWLAKKKNPKNEIQP
jgi:hypothetical protein